VRVFVRACFLARARHMYSFSFLSSLHPFDVTAVLNRLSLLRCAFDAAVQPAIKSMLGFLRELVAGEFLLRELVAGPPPPAPPPLAPVCAARDWALLLLTSALAAALALHSDRARPSLAASASVLPALLGAWWCHGGGGSTGADEDRALALLWSLVGLAFVGVFCAAMLGVRDTVRERDLERAMTDTLSLFVSFAPAGHTALLWLSQGPTVCASAVVAGQAGAALGAVSRWLRLSARQYILKSSLYSALILPTPAAPAAYTRGLTSENLCQHPAVLSRRGLPRFLCAGPALAARAPLPRGLVQCLRRTCVRGWSQVSSVLAPAHCSLRNRWVGLAPALKRARERERAIEVQKRRKRGEERWKTVGLIWWVWLGVQERGHWVRGVGLWAHPPPRVQRHDLSAPLAPRQERERERKRSLLTINK